MKTGPKGLALIKEFEGCELTAYRDAVGVWTIGYGHTAAAGDPIPTPGMTITEAEAEEILRRDLVKYERAVLDAVTVPLSQEQFDALMSWTFNLGPGNLRNSTMLKKINAGDFAAVPEQIARWNRAGGKVLRGLIRRREAEGKLFASGTVQALPPDIEPIPPLPASGGFFVALKAFLEALFGKK